MESWAEYDRAPAWKSAIRDFGKGLPAIKSQIWRDYLEQKGRPVSLYLA